MSGAFSDLADRVRQQPPVVVIVGPEGGYRMHVGGVTVLERVLWGLSREGVVTADVAAEPFALRPDLPLVVVWVAPETAPEDGARVIRGDEVQGTRVVDAASADALERALCLHLAKSHQGLIDGWINWRLSTPITRLLSHTSLRPNHVTAVSMTVGLAGCLSAACGGSSWGCLALGGVLMQLQSVLDSCDGELARLRFQGSKLGQWLDNVSDDVLDALFVVGAGVAAGGGWFTLALATSVARSVAQSLAYHEVYRRYGTGDLYAFRIWFQQDEKSVDDVFAIRGVGDVVRAFGRRDAYVFAWMVLCLLGLPQAVVVYGAVLGSMIAVMMALHVVLRRPLPAKKQ